MDRATPQLAVMKLYQSFIGDEQRSFVSPNTIPFDAQANTGKDQREYELLKTIWTDQLPSYQGPWGLISWKFQHKCLISPDELIQFSKQKFALGFDCVFINPMIGNESIYFNVWEQGIDGGHKGLDKIYAFLSQNLGSYVSAPMGFNCFAFCNYFIANKRFWTGYFKFVDEALSSLDAEATKKSEAGLIYSGSANYSRDAEATMRPFVIERLFSSFITGSPFLKCINFEYKLPHYQRKFGEQLGGFLHKLSVLKNTALNTNDDRVFESWNHVRLSILKNPLKMTIWHLDDPTPFFLTSGYTDFMNR